MPVLIRSGSFITSAMSFSVFDNVNMRPNCRFKKLFGYIFSFVTGVDKEKVEAANEKSIEMIKSKDLLPLTGYIHGGCSPIGMKKQFKTVIDASAAGFDTIIFSGGKIGYQVETSLDELKRLLRFELSEVSD